MTKWKPCKIHKSIRLNPDFTSSGMECNDCGIVFGQPKLGFPLLPDGVISLVQIWNDYWEYASDNTDLLDDGKEYVEKDLLQAGEALVTIVSEYYPCCGNEKNWKLFQWWKIIKTYPDP